jgi:hypothetical protein
VVVHVVHNGGDVVVRREWVDGEMLMTGSG